MNRNASSHFALAPQVDIQRSRFDRSFGVKTTADAGQLFPIFLDQDILPGDTINIKTSSLVRMATPIYPVMDNAVMDVYYFFVPNRLVWEHWKEFMGENTQEAWAPTTEYNIPQICSATRDNPAFGETGDYGIVSGSIGDYFGLPFMAGSYVSNDGELKPRLSVSALPFRAYVKIWNEWFRDQNTMPPAYLNTDDMDTTFTLKNLGKLPNGLYSGKGTYSKSLYTTSDGIDNLLMNASEGGFCLPVSKFHDYFTSALPSPQKGEAVMLPLNGEVPIYAMDKYVPGSSETSLKWSTSPTGNEGDYRFIGARSMESGEGFMVGDTVYLEGNKLGSYNPGDLAPANLFGKLDLASTTTINELRLAFQVQKLLERDARGGSRYRELIKSHFNVTSPDARMQIPEYLGGKRIPISMQQVPQTSATDSTSPQGNVSAYSLTTDIDDSFTYSATEHGILIGVACIRTTHTYQQGIERGWSRKTRYDYYWPVLANIGEQAILNKEIYCTGSDTDEEGFGFNEAWADYRYKPNRVTGGFRTGAGGEEYGLDSWHYADYYTDMPYLSPSWMVETSENVERTLAVESDTVGYPSQFLCDFYFNYDHVRPMPMYSIPGMIDHN